MSELVRTRSWLQQISNRKFEVAALEQDVVSKLAVSSAQALQQASGDPHHGSIMDLKTVEASNRNQLVGHDVGQVHVLLRGLQSADFDWPDEPVTSLNQKWLAGSFPIHAALGLAASSTVMPVSSLFPRARVDRSTRQLLNEIDNVASSASERDWDGEDALPVDAATVSVAKELVNFFPALRLVPEVVATPHGEIDFDWWIGKKGMFTVSVGPPPHDIVFVANLEDLEVRGRERWAKNLPSMVSCCFQRMKVGFE